MTVPGRTAHAAATQAPWQAGGAVSAAEKCVPIINALAQLRDEWRDRPDQHHAFSPPSKLVVTKLQAGNWDVSYAESGQIQCHISYHAGAQHDVWGEALQREVEATVRRAADLDSWLREHQPTVTWSHGAVPAAEVSPDEPVVQQVLETSGSLRQPGQVAGMPFWCDAASFIRGGIPAVIYGPGDVQVAHAVDEFVPLGELVAATQVLAVTAIQFCGLAK